MAAALKNEPGLDVHLIEGAHGEFTVSVGGQVVAQKTDPLPPVEQVVSAVRNAESHPAAV